MNKLNYEYISPTQTVIGTKYDNPFRIQASAISQFFSETHKWYRERVLKCDPGFIGSDSSVLGTCTHFLAQQYTTNGVITPADYAEIQAYIAEQSKLIPLDIPELVKQYPIMGQTLINYLYSNPCTIAEAFTEFEILPGITAGGSIDNLTSNQGYSAEELLQGKGTVTIRDYKTTSAMSAPTTFSKPYQFQLLVYAWVLHQYGITVTTMELVYVTRDNCGRISEVTGKPMKDYPSTISVISKAITSEDLDFIGSLIQLIAESVHTFQTKPELRYLLAQDLRLKNNTDQLVTTSIEI